MNTPPEWGVMFNDGSVRHDWNGSTQRQRAQEAAEELARRYPSDRITLAHRVDGQWRREEET